MQEIAIESVVLLGRGDGQTYGPRNVITASVGQSQGWVVIRLELRKCMLKASGTKGEDVVGVSLVILRASRVGGVF